MTQEEIAVDLAVDCQRRVSRDRRRRQQKENQSNLLATIFVLMTLSIGFGYYWAARAYSSTSCTVQVLERF